MASNLNIDMKLLEEALEVSGLSTKKDVVNASSPSGSTSAVGISIRPGVP